MIPYFMILYKILLEILNDVVSQFEILEQNPDRF